MHDMVTHEEIVTGINIRRSSLLLPHCYQDRTNQPHLASATLDPGSMNGTLCTRPVI